MSIEQYIRSLFLDENSLKEYLKTIVSSRTVLNVPIPQCFYTQDFVKWYKSFTDEIESICKNHSYIDKRKNDIMKQRKVQFAYWYECKRLLGVIEYG